MTLLDADVKQRRDVLGEDTWDLFATIENSFGFTFPNYEAILGVTVQELAQIIMNQSTYPPTDRCLSSVTFYTLRRAFQEKVGTSRSEIRPQTALVALLPWSGRSKHWRGLQEEIGLELPPLTFPLWLFALSIAITLASSVLISTEMKALFDSGLSVMGMVFASFCLWIFVLRILIPLGRGIPKGCETFGGLVKAVLARNYATFASRYGSTTLDEVTALLSQLIASEVGLSPAEISRTTRIPSDLNIE